MKRLVLLLCTLNLIPAAQAADSTAEVKNLSVNGGVEDGKARLVIEALLNRLPGEQDKAIFATALEHSIKITPEKLTDSILATLDILEGEPKELPFTITGEGEIRQVTGEALLDWSIRQETNGLRTLVLRPRKTDKPLTRLTVNIVAERELKGWSNPLTPLTLTPAQPALFSGYLKVESAPELQVQPDKISGLIPIELKFLPDSLRGGINADEPEPLAFRFQGAAYSLPLKISFADPEARRVVLRNCKLTGKLGAQIAAFTLTATARVTNPKGGSLNLLSGGVALADFEPQPGWRVRLEQDRFVLTFDAPGEFPIQLKFNAAVRQRETWNSIEFHVASSALQPIVLQGLGADTQFEFAGAARPERTGNDFISYLPSDGTVKLSWKEARPEAEGKLFYAAEMLSQISVSPGLMRQVALLDFKVMQGELNRVALLLRGAGEVTRVQGDQVLAWNAEPVPNSNDRRLVVQFNQPQKDQSAIQVQMQTPLGAFPQTADAMQLRPEGATRFAGYFRIVNEGAVRLEVAQATGLSQISPDQFPESDATRAALRVTGSQRFAYRFSGADFALRIQADQILPELSVSQVLAYHLGESELAIDAEIELDIREAPLRELLLRLPKGYAIARLTGSGLTDYFPLESDDQPDSILRPVRLVYGQPVSGRQLIQLRLERNQPLGETNWTLPRIETVKAKSVRGHVAVAADAGFRLTAERTQALTEIATAFFPRKVPGIQAAFRLSDPAWQATLRVERLPQTVQADAFHLFSIGEGIAYGSSVMNYLVSGAPLAAFKVELSDEYFNVEFSGKDIRNWQKTERGYVVQLHTPVSGAYTLLATYERPFKAQGETLTFTGARPLDAQSEQGYTLIISAYQFQVKPVDVSAGLLALETGEVPPEYRLFFDAPILAAYRYTSRPFNLKLALSPLAQGDSLSQVVDRGLITTRISKEGQALTDVRYFVKNRGNPHLRLTLPTGMQLWSASVNGVSVVPVTDAQANLIPLPQHADPNAVLTLDLKLAGTNDPKLITVAAPIVNVPVMLAEWKLEPDTGQRLVYRHGSLTPMGGIPDVSGFAELARMFTGNESSRALTALFAALALMALAVLAWRWTAREGVYRFSVRHLSGTLLGLLAFVLAVVAFINLCDLAQNLKGTVPRDVTLLAPIQQAGSALTVEVANLADKPSVLGFVRFAWPALLALAVWVFGWITERPGSKTVGRVLGWTLLAWAALRCPNGATFFLAVFAAFLLFQVVTPALRRLWNLPRQPRPALPPVARSGTAPAATALLVGGLMWASFSGEVHATGYSDSSSKPGFSTQGVPLPPGLVGWWAGEGNASDSTGANNGTVQGAVTFTPGVVGQAFSFNPAGGTVIVPDSSSLRLTSQLTIEAWVNLNTISDSGGYSIVSKLGIATGNNGYQFVVVGKAIHGQFNSPGQGWPSARISSGPIISTGVWYHVAFTYDGSAMKLYCNGQLVATDVIGAQAIATSTSDLRISGTDNHVYFDGLIDEPSVYNRALSAAEIAAIYNAGSAGKGGLTPRVHYAQASGPLAESVSQNIRIEDKFALATAKIRWQAAKGQMLPVLFEPAVLTRISYPTNSLKLVQAQAGPKRAQQLLAQDSGTFDVELQYQLQVTKRDTESGVVLPVPYGLVNRLQLTLVSLDVDVLSPQAVSVQRYSAGSNTVANLVLSPVNDAWIAWKPLSRDVKREKPVFYAEISQLYAPAAGVIEGAHYVAIRPAQGELGGLILDVPAGTTITDVIGSGSPAAADTPKGASVSLVSLWRFDPDARKLRVTLNPPQSRPFALLVRSQVAAGPLPFEHSIGLVSVDNTAGQIGLLGIATGNEVQLDSVSAETFSPINLEDFPTNVVSALQPQIPWLALRRAFRYAETKAAAVLKASAVEPDVRVETQDTLSLSEDRTVLAANANVTITRAGIFRLSFVMPVGYDVESISGSVLSHWTESKTDAGRVITLHLGGKTEGQQQFAISLAGPGVKATNAWTVPQLVLREASKQRGTLLLVPEQGMRLQVVTRDGVTQLDPQKSGIRQKGVLAFSVLQMPWSLVLDIEQVDPWIQVTSLQHATVNEALVKVAANLQYQIENTGLKAFHVFIPTNAETVRFQGDQVADFLPVAGTVTNGMQEWEVKLHRRVIGSYFLQATYQTILPERATETVLRGLQAADVNLQRGFVTVQAGGRLQMRIDVLPAALQPTEWQSIPRVLQQNLPAAAANFAYRLVEPAFALPLQLEHHEAAKLLPARVNNITFTSVISDDGEMLTQVRLEIVPGDKRLLNLTLPKDARFWFAFVNQNGVWPWREQERYLIPLEQQSRGGKAIPVEVFYSSHIGSTGGRALDLDLVAPKFDLPLENLTWRVWLSDKWQLKHWAGSLQLQQDEIVPRATTVDLQTYLQGEAIQQRERTKEAEELMAAGNNALQLGDPKMARRAFQSAYGLSAGDAAFNEDARVQLHNIKLQQALVGLNVRQAAVAGDTAVLGGKFRDLRGRKEVNYTQQDAKDIIDRNTADDNAAYMRLAERIIQQQDAAVSTPAAIRASIPEQGRVLTFKRAVVVDTWADLKIRLEATAAKAAPWAVRVLILAGSLLILACFAWAARSFRPARSQNRP